MVRVREFRVSQEFWRQSQVCVCGAIDGFVCVCVSVCGETGVCVWVCVCVEGETDLCVCLCAETMAPWRRERLPTLVSWPQLLFY